MTESVPTPADVAEANNLAFDAVAMMDEKGVFRAKVPTTAQDVMKIIVEETGLAKLLARARAAEERAKAAEKAFRSMSNIAQALLAPGGGEGKA